MIMLAPINQFWLLALLIRIDRTIVSNSINNVSERSLLHSANQECNVSDFNIKQYYLLMDGYLLIVKKRGER